MPKKTRHWHFAEDPLWDERWKSITLIDTDFDDFGGNVTFDQICNPQQDLYDNRSPNEKIRLRYARPRSVQKDYLLAKLDRAWEKRNRAREHTKCRGCIPYNGSHTLNYWNTGQKDPW